jgi:hypothetical protein
MTLFARPECPNCRMSMIVVGGFKKEPEEQTFDCLRCGNVRQAGPLNLVQKRKPRPTGAQ